MTKDDAKNLLGFANLSESHMRYKTNSCILQLTLKSMYEMTRHGIFG